MTRSSRNVVLLSLLLVCAAVAAGLLWALGGTAPPPRAVDAAPPPGLVEEPLAGAEAVERDRPDLAAPAADDDLTDLSTSVIWPLRVELDLVRADYEPEAEGVPALGAAATAKLSGSVLTGADEGVRAEVRFVAGANEGRVLYADRRGRFGASDLLPGLSVVRVSGPGIGGAERELLLRQERETLLNLSFGRLGGAHGAVVDEQGEPLAAARVTIDGQSFITGEDGTFFASGLSGGHALVYVEKEGYVTHREILPLTAGHVIEAGRLQFTLARGGALEVTVAEAIGAEGQASLYVFPTQGAPENRTVAWERYHPIRVYPGGTVLVEDLPPGRVNLRLFHSGARANPRLVSARVVAGEVTPTVLHLEDAPSVSGVVTRGGQPVEGAAVTLRTPDPQAAALATYGRSDFLFLESAVLPSLPPVSQETRTDARGRYSLTAWEDVSAVRYLVAVGPDGQSYAGRAVRAGEREVDLQLDSRGPGEAQLVLQMDGRYQGLPVEIVVDGAPRDPLVLAPGRDLRVEGLVPGSWVLSVRWDTEELVDEQPIELHGEVKRAVELPEGALFGQDAEQKARAGR